ncbi:MAG: helix-turn-helix domain-containing protein [Trichodesmium sp. MAG_R04]|nr:helix-turn-helix domain-containing protein [Trichodesmium sp. MAG_R04]
MIEYSKWQIIWLLAKGSKSEEVATVIGLGLQWIRAIAQRFNKGGPAVIGDGRHQNQGAKPLLPEQQPALLV